MSRSTHHHQTASHIRTSFGNKLAEPPRTPLLGLFFKQFWDPMILILLTAAAVSMFLGESADTVVILLVVILNSVVGVVQEGRARHALEALKRLTAPTALLYKNEQLVQVPAASLLPGDVVFVEAGCQVPADLQLTGPCSLSVDESILTGESLPVSKTRTGDELYMSTFVCSGCGYGKVTRIGMDTKVGQIAGLLSAAPPNPTPLQKQLSALGKLLGILSVGICLLLLAIGLLKKAPFGEILLTSVSLAVAAVPEGLPAIVTMVLSLSVTGMAACKTIVRKLPAVETLGSVHVICSDKTGTLTCNRMTVTELFPAHPHAELLKAMALCNTVSENGLGDPTETALCRYADAQGVCRKKLLNTGTILSARDFDSDRKRMSVLYGSGSEKVLYCKGSPDIILARCTGVMVSGHRNSATHAALSEASLREIRMHLAEMTANAMRVLAFAEKRPSSTEKVFDDAEENLVLLGLVGMKDPLRPEVYGAIRTCKEAGILPVMITGDRPDTALAVSKEAGIATSPRECICGTDLDRLLACNDLSAITAGRVFAQVTPSHKTALVEAFQKAGNVVAMTGDGVNDAPSLRYADVGIAMGKGGTDVARNAADLVLTDDNFSTIVKAVELGRNVYANIRKTVVFLLSSNLGEVMTMITAAILSLPSPLLPSHILWINLITDSLPALALGTDPVPSGRYMKEPPRKAGQKLLSPGDACRTLFYGIIIAGVSMLAFFYPVLAAVRAQQLQNSALFGEALRTGSALRLSYIMQYLRNGLLLSKCRTYAFLTLGMSQLFHALGMRDVRRSFFLSGPLRNKLLVFALAAGCLLQLITVSVPGLCDLFGTVLLSPPEIRGLLFLSLAPLVIHEIMVLISKKRVAS